MCYPLNLSWKKVKVKSPNCVPLFATPWTIQSMEFFRPEYWSRYLSLLQGIFPTQGSNPGSCIAGRFFTSWATREAQRKKQIQIQKIRHSLKGGMCLKKKKKWGKQEWDGAVSIWLLLYLSSEKAFFPCHLCSISFKRYLPKQEEKHSVR